MFNVGRSMFDVRVCSSSSLIITLYGRIIAYTASELQYQWITLRIRGSDLAGISGMFFGYPTMMGAAILKSSGIPMDFKSSEDFIWVPKPIQQVPKPLSEKGSAPSELCLSYNIKL